MTDRYDYFVVKLKEPRRDDDSEHVITALKMISGVEQVVPHVSGFEAELAKESARRELVSELWEVLKR